MKNNRSEELKNKFFNAETSDAEEQWLKNNADEDAYFNFLKEEQQAEMLWSFDDFLQEAKAQKTAIVPVKKKRKFVWYAAASVLLLAMGGMFLLNDFNRTASSFVLNDVGNNANTIYAKISENMMNTSFQKKEPLADVAKISLKKNIKQHLPKAAAKQKYLSDQPEDKDEVAYVFVNGKPVYDEAEAEKITLESLDYLAKNVKTGAAEMKVLKNLSIKL